MENNPCLNCPIQEDFKKYWKFKCAHNACQNAWKQAIFEIIKDFKLNIIYTPDFQCELVEELNKWPIR